MVRRFLRTRSRKRVRKVTPGGLKVTHFKREKPGKTVCGRCRKNLAGMPNRIPSELVSLKKSERIPSRPYAGVLCNRCLDDLVRYATRFEVKYSNPEYKTLELQRDLTLERFLPQGWHAQVSEGKIRLEKVLAKKETAAEKAEEAVEKPAVKKAKKPAAKKTKA
jgi:large subunit ribosomal protein L34e